MDDKRNGKRTAIVFPETAGFFPFLFAVVLCLGTPLKAYAGSASLDDVYSGDWAYHRIAENSGSVLVQSVWKNAEQILDEALPKVDFSAEYASSPYYQALQEVVLTGNYRQDMIAVAASQIGYGEGDQENDLDGSYHGKKNYTEYGRYLGSNGTPWCSEFASWCARAARIPASILNNSKSANVTNFGAPYYSWSQTIYCGGSYTPRAGDIALFAWHGTLTSAKNLSHTAIIYDVKTSGSKIIITVIEGNFNGVVRKHVYIAEGSDGDVEKGYLVYFIAPDYEAGEK